MYKFHHNSRRLCAVLIGLVFLVSGLLKLMDPVGTGLKMQEYFKFLHLGFLSPLGKGLGVAFSLLEALVGAALVSGIALKLTEIVALGLIGFFTVLTLLLYIANPQMDCGCFGEAVHLTHFQSLMKNVVLTGLSLFAFIPLRDGYEARRPKTWGFGIVTLLILLFTFYSLRALPLHDFTAFSCGSQVVSDAVEVDPGLEQSAAVLPVRDVFGEYCDALATTGEVLVISVYEPGRLDASRWERIGETIGDAYVCGIQPLLLVPAADEVPVTLGECLFFSDARTLMTLNRSNGGASYLSDGLVVAKWEGRSLPDAGTLSDLLTSEPVEVASLSSAHTRMAFQGLVLLSVALLMLL